MVLREVKKEISTSNSVDGRCFVLSHYSASFLSFHSLEWNFMQQEEKSDVKNLNMMNWKQWKTDINKK